MFFSAAPPTPAIIYGKLIQSSLSTSSGRYISHLPIAIFLPIFFPPFPLCVCLCLFVWFHPILPIASLLEYGTLKCYSTGCFIFRE